MNDFIEKRSVFFEEWFFEAFSMNSEHILYREKCNDVANKLFYGCFPRTFPCRLLLLHRRILPPVFTVSFFTSYVPRQLQTVIRFHVLAFVGRPSLRGTMWDVGRGTTTAVWYPPPLARRDCLLLSVPLPPPSSVLSALLRSVRVQAVLSAVE